MRAIVNIVKLPYLGAARRRIPKINAWILGGHKILTIPKRSRTGTQSSIRSGQSGKSGQTFGIKK